MYWSIICSVTIQGSFQKNALPYGRQTPTFFKKGKEWSMAEIWLDNSYSSLSNFEQSSKRE
jgi:hypothetical protein